MDGLLGRNKTSPNLFCTMEKNGLSITVRLLCFFVAISFIPQGYAQYRTCYERLGEADFENGGPNDVLSRPEYAVFLLRMSRSTIDFNDQSTVPTSLVNTFLSAEDSSIGGISLAGIKDGAEAAEVENIDELCGEIYLGLSARFNTSTTSGDCTDSLTTGSSSGGEGEPFSRSHFLVFAKELSAKAIPENPLSSFSSYDALPDTVQEVFVNYAANDEIDRSKFSSFDAIEQICVQTLVGVKIDAELGANFNDTAYVPCAEALRLQDNDEDEQLDGAAFARYVSAESNGDVTATTLADLPDELETLFLNLSNQSDMLALPGLQSDQALVNDKTFILSVCDRTSSMLETIRNTATETPTSAPSPMNDMQPTVNSDPQNTIPYLPTAEQDSCEQLLMVSDGGRRDDMLEEREYIVFLNKLSPRLYADGTMFADISIPLQEAFNKFKDSNGSVDVTASKPWNRPSDEQTNIVLGLCAYSEDAVANFANQQTTSSPTPVPEGSTETVAPVSMPAVSPAFYIRCKASMRSSDSNGSDSLSTDEYVRFLNFLTVQRFSGMQYSDLSPLFHMSFDESKQADGTIDISGTALPNPPLGVDSHLRFVCSQAEQAITQYENFQSTSPTAGPSAAGPGSSESQSPTPAPTLSEKFFSDCRLALIIADTEYNNDVTSSEYVRFLNFLTKQGFASFDALSPVFKSSFDSLSQGTGSITFGGIRPGERASMEQEERVASICSETGDSIHRFNNGDIPTLSPTTISTTDSPSSVNPGSESPGATSSPSSSPTVLLTNAEYDQCKSAIIRSDLNQDEALSESEYIRFLNQFRSNDVMFGPSLEITDSTFTAQHRRVHLERANGITISGVKSFPASPLQTLSLRHLCTDVVVAFRLFDEETGTEYNRRCFEEMTKSDANDDKLLTEGEFFEFLRNMSPTLLPLTPETFPYIARDSFKWATLGQSVFGIESLDSAMNETDPGVMRTGLLCAQIRATIASRLTPSSPTTLIDFCADATADADLDGDDKLDQQEYVHFITNFSQQGQPGSELEEFDPAITATFDLHKNSSTIDVSGAGSDRTEDETMRFETFCNDVETAVATWRKVQGVVPQCRDSFSVADLNSDNILSDEEYPAFLQSLADFSIPVSYKDIENSLQQNFDAMKRGAASVEIQGFKSDQEPTLDQRNQLRAICLATFDAIQMVAPSQPPTVSPSVLPGASPSKVDVSNAFILSNENGLRAFDIQTGKTAGILGKSYSRFINGKESSFSSLGQRRLRAKRHLESVNLVINSTRLIAYEDIECPEGESAVSLCTRVFGRFTVEIEDTESKESIAILSSGITQAAIAAGELQTELESSSSQVQVEVIAASDKVNPDAPTESDVVVEKSSTSLLLVGIAGGLGGLAAVLTMVLLLWCYRRRNALQMVEPDSLGKKKMEPNHTQGPLLGDPDNIQEGDSLNVPKKAGVGIFSYGNDSDEDATSENQFSFTNSHTNSNNSTYKDDHQRDSFFAEASNNDEHQADSFFADSRIEDGTLEKGGSYNDEGSESYSQSDEESAPETNSWGANDPWTDTAGQDPGTIVSDFQASFHNQEAGFQDGNGFADFDGAKDSGSEGSDAESQYEFESDYDSHATPDRSATGDEEASGNRTRSEAGSRQSFSQGDDDDDDEDEESEQGEYSSEEEGEDNAEEEGMEDDDDDSYSQSSSGKDYSQGSEEDNGSHSDAGSLTSEEQRTQDFYRPQIMRLVRNLMPEELDNVDGMMSQFVGREQELVTTLSNMAGTITEDKTYLTTASDINSENDPDEDVQSEDDEDESESDVENDVYVESDSSESESMQSSDNSYGSYSSDSYDSNEDSVASGSESDDGGSFMSQDESLERSYASSEGASYEENTVYSEEILEEEEVDEEEYDEESYADDRSSYEEASVDSEDDEEGSEHSSDYDEGSEDSSDYDEETYVDSVAS